MTVLGTAAASADRTIELLEGLVNLDSASDHAEGVNRVGGVLADRLRSLGFAVEMVPAPPPYGKHVVGRLGPGPYEALIVGHMDTALPRGTANKRPFSWEGERMFGVGVHDMKGGIACSIVALEALLGVHPDVGGIAVLFNSDEEPGSPHSRQVLRDLAGETKRALILEPGSERAQVTTGRKGVGIFHFRVTGIASHAGSEPERGASAVHDLNHKALCCLGLANPALGTTVNIGAIRGGTYPYVVAERAEMDLDVRVWSSEEAQRVEAGLGAVSGMSFVPRTQTELLGSFHRSPMQHTPGNQEVFEDFREVAAEIGLDLEASVRGGASDGNLTSAWGVPTLDGLGPAGGGSHGDDEFIFAESLAERTSLLALALERFTVRP